MSLADMVMKEVDGKLKNFAKKAEQTMKGEAHVKTGALVASITTDFKDAGEFTVGVDGDKLKSNRRNKGGVDYALFYWKGHRGYTIRPKNAKALSWIGPDGKRRFAKSVKIPAHAGDPFIERTLARLKSI